MHKLLWYFNRFKMMSVPEINFRFFQSARHLSERYTKTGKTVHFEKIVPAHRLFPDYSLDAATTLPEEIPIFGIPFNYSKPTNWHNDVVSKLDFPKAYSRSIDIRTPKYGSAKAVWEINRMLFLPWICINFRSTGNPHYLALFQEKITSWAEQNPFLIGVNWYSNIEVNIRLINWVICWEILEAETRAESDPKFRKFLLDQWLPLIHLHCEYSCSNPSLFSSANNHLIAEYSGLFLASIKWDFPESVKWQKYARKGLEKEIIKQHTPHGINREEAAEYIQFITDFFLIPFVAVKNLHSEFSAEYTRMLNKIFRYIYVFTDCTFNFPQYGDEDDGKVILLDASGSYNNFRSLMISGALIADNHQFLEGIRETDNKNLLLFGETGRKKTERWISSLPHTRQSPAMANYEEDGHYIIKDLFEPGKEIYIHIDAAPLGYLSMAAHGHADALSFILHLNGIPFFVDSGTYTYHTDPEFRNYFVGTIAHNTIRVNQCDQAMNGGPTLWINQYTVFHEPMTQKDNRIRIAAEHDGYKTQRIIHRREFLYAKTEKLLLITDTIRLDRRKETFLELPFHVHPDVQISALSGDNGYTLQSPAGIISVKTDPQIHYKIRCGELNPILGWYSASFNKKQPAPVLYGSVAIAETSVFKTEIRVIGI